MKLTNDNWIARSFNYLEQAFEDGGLTTKEYVERLPQKVLNVISDLQNYQQEIEPLLVGEPLQLTPQVGVIFENDRIRIIQGAYGKCIENKDVYLNSQMRCGACGSTAFNGVRCVMCGEMGDD